MKTPEQIADEIMGYQYTDHDGRVPSEPEQIEALIVAAIEADRAQREPYVGTEFKVGDVVRLTGSAWTEYGVQDQVVTVTRIDRMGYPETDTPEGFSIYDTTSEGGEDCSATLVSRKEG